MANGWWSDVLANIGGFLSSLAKGAGEVGGGVIGGVQVPPEYKAPTTKAARTAEEARQQAARERQWAKRIATPAPPPTLAPSPEPGWGEIAGYYGLGATEPSVGLGKWVEPEPSFPPGVKIGEEGAPLTPSTPLEVAVAKFGARFADLPPIGIPPELMTEEMPVLDRYGWLQANIPPEQVTIIIGGREVSLDDARKTNVSNPDLEVVKVYAMGGGDVVEVPMSLQDALGETIEESMANLAGRRQVEMTAEARAGREALETEKDEILSGAVDRLTNLVNTGASNEEIAKAYDKERGDLISLFYKGVKEGIDIAEGKPDIRNWAGSELARALPGDVFQRASAAGAEWAGVGAEIPRPPEEEILPEVVDVEELRRLLTPYGIEVLGAYPYLTPASEALLSTLPINVRRMMAQYLAEKDLSFGDYLELSAPYYRTTAGAGGRWTIPQQW